MGLIQSLLIVALSGAAAEGDLIGQVRCLETAFSQSAERRDPEAFIGFVDADARFVSGEVLHGPAAVLEDWTPLLTEGGPEIRWRPQLVQVTASGDLALTRGPYRVRATNPEGETVESWGTFTSVWRKSAEGWRVLFDAGADRGMQPSDAQRTLLESDPECASDSTTGES